MTGMNGGESVETTFWAYRALRNLGLTVPPKDSVEQLSVIQFLIIQAVEWSSQRLLLPFGCARLTLESPISSSRLDIRTQKLNVHVIASKTKLSSLMSAA